ncbi:hypothetical protein [Micromonospora sagamiensis]|uniref:Uncharacterized protein n=1 Tax=Micromonospora sagamiensis TaxID=47875 RepID=A0A562WPN8_9ACTN|nr:hypothetical protein [Micromonospora sagamiensis]TWJ32300.1 hypothetical protein JD81_05875 [Micromonospora sagamiensis]BCL14636.1 hypothetical protein GCM10017556_23750 [Micromonospora sagamiensis]
MTPQPGQAATNGRRGSQQRAPGRDAGLPVGTAERGQFAEPIGDQRTPTSFNASRLVAAGANR